MSAPGHHWVRLPHRVEPAALPALLAEHLPTLAPALTEPVDAHRRLRGPYTATGTMLRAVVPHADPDLVRRHEIELFSAAPELRETVTGARETLTSLAVPKERTRFYSRLRTQRMAHGIVEFLHAHLAGSAPRSLVVLAAEADRTDLEFLSALLRRTDPAVLTVVVCDTGEPPGEPLAADLAEHTTFHEVTAPRLESTVDARLFVAADCVSDDPGLVAAYERLSPAERAELHDRRAEELAARGEFSLTLGAIPYHRQHGSDPAVKGADALAHALNHCLDMGYYHATIELGQRGRTVVDVSDLARWWVFTTKMTTSLAALNRPREAEALYTEILAETQDPGVHLQACYAVGMLYTRHHAEQDRDHVRAKGLINQAVALARLCYTGADRVFNTVFQRNGLALVEAHMGNPQEALRLVTEGIAEMDAELGADEHALHRSVLVHNQAQVLTGLGRLDEALACYDEVIARDPNYPDYHFDRGNLNQRLGRDDEAMADYETAIRLGPPFPEAQYNRAELLLRRGDDEAALAGLSYTLTLEPDMVDALVNRAGLHLDLGNLTAARTDAEQGLRYAPDNAHLHAVLGQVHSALDEHVEARAAFNRALTADPTLVAALAGRAATADALGDPDQALADLDAALALTPDDPALLYNRAYLHESANRPALAVADLLSAHQADPEDEDVAEALARCQALVPA
ncbi:tetratricopeptide repeat protein [Actinokineospora diospyrosa]|uniref:Flp pilus assembly protein TadD, contains TPR repeats n=1 Tax=Actinokineospora diospyrosa TaxID=103728 RepID=A0ABT1IBU4_9PSEU|nr:tetratricopeptide repeat protein [Actinokineospora diospyrosa]MCP2270097.1 Flp pilus assembly protein TadD, contains TPR repeats [Actinokineospora diospyrosa]